MSSLRAVPGQRSTNHPGSSPLAAIARWCITHRLVAVLLWLLALVGVATAAGVAGAAYSNDYEVPGTESGRATALLQEGFHGQGGDSDTIVWHTDTGSVRAAGVEQRDVRDAPRGRRARRGRLRRQPVRQRGRRPDQLRRAHRLRHRHLRPAGRRHSQGAGRGGRRHREGSRDRRAPGRAGRQRHRAHRGVRARHVAEIVGVVVAAVVLFLAFGSLAASLLPIATALVSVGTAYAGIVLLGHVMTVADFAPMLGMLIGLGVGIDYALFIVTRHRKGLRRGLPVAEAARDAVATTGRAVVFAGATVCIALLGMLILQLSFLNGVAIAACLTVVLTVAASVTLLPALLSFIGMRALSRRERRRLDRARSAARAADRLRRPLVRLRRTPSEAARSRRRGGHAGAGPADVLAPPRHLRPGQRPVIGHHPPGVRPAGGGLRPRRQRPAHPRRPSRRRRRPAGHGQAARRPARRRWHRVRRPGHVQRQRRHGGAHRRTGLRTPVEGDQRARRPAARRRPARRVGRHLARRSTSAV